MERRSFLNNTIKATAAIALTTTGLGSLALISDTLFPTLRVPEHKRKFNSPSVELLINTLTGKMKNKELAWLFGNCFPNTLDTTVEYSTVDGKPDTYVITGDIDAMWLRDSSAQVWPYIPLCSADEALRALIAGVINRQTRCILLDPYANAFYKDSSKESEWKNDVTVMKPGIHERKWEIDSLCYPVRLAYGYYRQTGDKSVLDAQWVSAMSNIIKTFREQQRKDNIGPYSFMRRTEWATDGVPLAGYGYPAKPNGMIFSMFRPSDDATIFPLFVPANFFAAESLKQMAEMLNSINQTMMAREATLLRDEVLNGLRECAIVKHKVYGDIYAYEVNGLGSCNLMDDANVPSLLSLAYLVPDMANDPVYLNTRRFVLSQHNPFYFNGRAGEGIGGPHAGVDNIWPLSIAMRGITATDKAEIKQCLKTLQTTHGGTGFMHESFHKDDATKYTRAWFAWANTLFGEFVWKVYREHSELLA
jgi:hypothetical protein